MAKKKSSVERFLALSDAEKEAEVSKFDEEFYAEKAARPLTAKERAHWKQVQAKLKRGRPKVGLGCKVISLSIERSLLARADDYARKQKISRAALVQRGLESVLEKAS